MAWWETPEMAVFLSKPMADWVFAKRIGSSTFTHHSRTAPMRDSKLRPAYFEHRLEGPMEVRHREGRPSLRFAPTTSNFFPTEHAGLKLGG